MTRDEAMALIRTECERQDAKWGADRHMNPFFWYAILAEEFGEIASDGLLAKDPANTLVEIVQVAAVCLNWLQSEDVVTERQGDLGC